MNLNQCNHQLLNLQLELPIHTCSPSQSPTSQIHHTSTIQGEICPPLRFEFRNCRFGFYGALLRCQSRTLAEKVQGVWISGFNVQLIHPAHAASAGWVHICTQTCHIRRLPTITSQQIESVTVLQHRSLPWISRDSDKEQMVCSTIEIQSNGTKGNTQTWNCYAAGLGKHLAHFHFAQDVCVHKDHHDSTAMYLRYIGGRGPTMCRVSKQYWVRQAEINPTSLHLIVSFVQHGKAVVTYSCFLSYASGMHETLNQKQ